MSLHTANALDANVVMNPKGRPKMGDGRSNIAMR